LGNRANITFVEWDPNPWEFLFGGPTYITINAITLLMFLVNFLYASYLIMKWVKANGIDWNIGFICLLLESISNLLRVLGMILAPEYSNFILPAVDIIQTFPLCISLIASILIVFFWLDLTSDPFYHGKFLGTMKVPAFIFICILLVVEISFDILRNINSTANLVSFTVLIAFYMLIHLCVVIFNFVAGYRILKRSKESKGKENQKLNRIIHRIIYSGVVTLCSNVVMFALVSPIADYPVGLFLTYWLVVFAFFLQSFFLITIFQLPQQKMKTGQTSSIKNSTMSSS